MLFMLPFCFTKHFMNLVQLLTALKTLASSDTATVKREDVKVKRDVKQ